VSRWRIPFVRTHIDLTSIPDDDSARRRGNLGWG
jgi:hypothetical protein